jgi:deoxyribonuclease V
MEIFDLHPWDVQICEAREIQIKLQAKIDLNNKIDIKKLRLIAGSDISCTPHGNRLYASAVIYNYPELQIVKKYVYQDEVNFPYVPGYLSFREAPVLLKLFKDVSENIDLLLCDGQGIAHPRGIGLASHLGLFLNLPTIGCAKSVLVGEYQEPGENKGCSAPLLFKNNVVGTVLRTRQGVKPIFVSPGHKIRLKPATEVVLNCCPRYRIPEPIRAAHQEVTMFRIREK